MIASAVSKHRIAAFRQNMVGLQALHAHIADGTAHDFHAVHRVGALIVQNIRLKQQNITGFCRISARVNEMNAFSPANQADFYAVIVHVQRTG